MTLFKDYSGYLSCHVELAPSQMALYEKILTKKKIDKISDFVKISEQEFENIKELTPLMKAKTRLLMQEWGLHFKMTPEQWIEAIDADYYKRHPDEMTDDTPSKIGNQGSESDNKADSVEEEAVVIVDPSPQNPAQDMKPEQMSEAEKQKRVSSIDSEIINLSKKRDALKMKRNLSTSPMEGAMSSDWAWCHFYCITDQLRYLPSIMKIFMPYKSQVERAIERGNMAMEMIRKDVFEKYQKNLSARTEIDNKINEIEDKLYQLRNEKRDLTNSFHDFKQ